MRSGRTRCNFRNRTTGNNDVLATDAEAPAAALSPPTVKNGTSSTVIITIRVIRRFMVYVREKASRHRCGINSARPKSFLLTLPHRHSPAN